MFNGTPLVSFIPRNYLFVVWFLQLSLGLQGENVDIYFGSGCFWHVQHEFIQAEKSILNRCGSNLTALSGYAGGSAAGTACYYDGKLHTEVIGLTIPRSSVKAFASVYWRLFVGMNRVDIMDVGVYYRAAIGVPGGMASPLLAEIRESMAEETNVVFRLEAGRGDDYDTLGAALVWVYDTAQYPFNPAEVYHQFHDDFLPGGNYPDSYEALRNTLVCSGRLSNLGCKGDYGFSQPQCTTDVLESGCSSASTVPDAHTENENQIVAPCGLPPKIRECENENQVPRYYFDSAQGKCVEFVWGGCGGNANNFWSEDACTTACSPTEVQTPATGGQSSPQSSPINLGGGSGGGSGGGVFVNENSGQNLEKLPTVSSAPLAPATTVSSSELAERPVSSSNGARALHWILYSAVFLLRAVA